MRLTRVRFEPQLAGFHRVKDESTFTGAELDALRRYQVADYVRINRFLRGTLPMPERWLHRRRILKATDLLDSALNKADAGKARVVFRGIPDARPVFGVDNLRDLVSQRRVDLGFLSTSETEEAAQLFAERGSAAGPVVVELHLAAGVRSLDVNDLIVNKPREDERERLLMRGLTVKFVDLIERARAPTKLIATASLTDHAHRESVIGLRRA